MIEYDRFVYQLFASLQPLGSLIWSVRMTSRFVPSHDCLLEQHLANYRPLRIGGRS